MIFEFSLLNLELFLLLIQLHLVLVVLFGSVVEVGTVILKLVWALAAMMVHLAHGFTIMVRLGEVEDEVGRLGRGILNLMLLRLNIVLAVTGLLADPSGRGHSLLNYRSHLIDDGLGTIAPRRHIHVL